MDLSLFGTIAGTIFGSSVLAEVSKGFFSRKKIDADAAGQTVDVILKWASTLTSRIEALEKSHAEKDTLISELRMRVAHLEATTSGGDKYVDSVSPDHI